MFKLVSNLNAFQNVLNNCAVTFPSPRPSPQRRGGIISSGLTNPRLDYARWLSEFKNVTNGCSLSPGERVRVRGNAAIKLEDPFQ
jgi:hypothetical protein